MAEVAQRRLAIDVDWTTHVSYYDMYMANPIRVSCGAMVKETASVYPMTSDSKILDVGSGTGGIERVIRERNVTVPILAVDYSQGMVDFLQSQNMHNVVVKRGDGANLKDVVSDAQFTHAFSSLVVQFVAANNDFCSEILRALVPGGHACISICSRLDIPEPFFEACRRLDPDYVRQEPNDGFSWRTVENLADGMARAGFVDLVKHKTEIWFPVESPEVFFDFFFNSKHPIFSELPKSYHGDQAALKAMFRQVLKEKYVGTKLLGTVEFVVGKKPN